MRVRVYMLMYMDSTAFIIHVCATTFSSKTQEVILQEN